MVQMEFRSQATRTRPMEPIPASQWRGRVHAASAHFSPRMAVRSSPDLSGADASSPSRLQNPCLSARDGGVCPQTGAFYSLQRLKSRAGSLFCSLHTIFMNLFNYFIVGRHCLFLSEVETSPYYIPPLMHTFLVFFRQFDMIPVSFQCSFLLLFAGPA